jgi:methylmalonyl-CoA/ethylmalonyl-CoA epimerase
MINKIDHVGIAVKNLDDMLKLYSGVLGLKVRCIESVESQKIRAAEVEVGDSVLEIMESTDPEGPIAKHIERRGEGLHHLAFEVEDIEAAMEELKKKGVTLVDAKPRLGMEKTAVAFLHPKGFNVLIELVDARKK